MIKDYEHYYHIAWTGPKFPPFQINFQRYATLAEANQALATWLEDPPGGFKTWGVVEHPATKFYTVGELKQALADVPDETPVYMEGSEWPMSWNGKTGAYTGSKNEPDGILLKC